MSPNYPIIAGYYPRQLIMTGQYDKAEEINNKWEILDPESYAFRMNKAWLFAARGLKDEALALHRDAAIYALLGMRDETIALLKKRTNNPMAESYLSLMHLPIYDSLRDDPRFQEILEKKKRIYEEFLKMSGEL
jgi:tetratricopeptide (TPR) repeat protein